MPPLGCESHFWFFMQNTPFYSPNPRNTAICGGGFSPSLNRIFWVIHHWINIILKRNAIWMFDALFNKSCNK